MMGLRITNMSSHVCKRALGLVAVMLVSACTSEHDKMLEQGSAVYTANCKVCHAQGINGAPIIGNNKMWGPRAEQGVDVLVEHASQGFGLMPAKGGNTSLTTEEIRSAVEYMLSQLD